ncbi:hypothetical protein HYR99_37295 [Candidatus Poribacteria bacterium]|nr:hypothetical protein [Candidatus Poribacteria bacterium]
MIAWHALELQVLRDQLTPQGCDVLAPYSIGEQPLEMDAVVRSRHLFEHQKRTLWLLVHLFRQHTILEIKSVAESFTLPKFHKLLGYSHLYLWKEELTEGALSTVALVTHLPEQVLAIGKWKRLGRGFYQRQHGFLVSLVVVNELPIRREYYPLLLLSSGKQRERFLKAILQAGDVYYLRYALLANSKEVLKMSEEMDLYLPMSLEENLQFLIEKGIFKPEAILKYLNPEERLRGLGTEELKKLKQLLENLDVSNSTDNDFTPRRG